MIVITYLEFRYGLYILYICNPQFTKKKKKNMKYKIWSTPLSKNKTVVFYSTG